MRLNTPTVTVGAVKIGGKNPIVIQSMTNTDTSDAKATAKQIIELADAGSEIVRMTVNTNLAAPKVPEIRKILDAKGYEKIPLIGDFHFNGHTLLEDFPQMSKTLDKYRINPGNVGYGDKHDYNFSKIIKIAIENNKPVRIGVNWGSLDQDLLTEMMNKNSKLIKPKSDKEVIINAMVESALRSAVLAEKIGLPQNKIILSVKMSIVQDMIKAYELLAQRMSKNKHLYALHLGLTEAGVGMQGIVSSSASLAILLQQGIGDTIRISLTPTPTQPRTKEVEACKILLQSMGFRHFKPQVTSCPGCGRTDSHFFQELAGEVNSHITKILPIWQKKHPKSADKIAELKIAVMGCVVNGPGESKHADIAISLPGRMEKPVAPVYIKGKFVKSLQGKKIPQQFIQLLEDYVEENFN
ncbi:MAG: flavodoxin-dependent (E)-4-hydroxy-3-methylbut-2-enyl-diphosphate synthase [Candidatus Peregrinibacteria bacterium]|nr:flavodoxin-dependent (E)-4-hydroxy-3-methylbut-2-enyl-diphosphate synthase [Candidatus Peregrinibacteria bacterium]